MTQVPQDATSTPTKADPAGAPTPDAVAGNDTGSVSGEDAKSIVSKNFSIVGDLTCHDVLHIDGSVEGNIACQQLTVSEGGRINGDVRADTVEMRGTLNGAIDARVLTLTKSSNVVGDIVVHEALGIEPGASFDGSCKKLAADTPQIETAEPEAADPEAATPQTAAVDAEPADAADELIVVNAPEDEPAANMSRAIDNVVAELKAGGGNAPPETAAAEPVAAPATTAPPLPDPSEPAENFAAAMAKPDKTGDAATPAPAAPGPAKPGPGSNGAAPAD